MAEWVGKEPTIESPYYPFRKVVEANTLSGIEQLPYIITRYLMDLPSRGYTPPTDNKYPRVRFKKMLYWDMPRPLEQPCPTTEQIKSIQFDPANPADPPDEARGYRIYSQELVQQAQASAQTIVRIYLGDTTRMQTVNEFVFRQAIIITVMVTASLEMNCGMPYGRANTLVQAIIEACEGVNFGGVGAFTLNRIAKFDDERTNTGYKIYAYIDWNGNSPNPYFE